MGAPINIFTGSSGASGHNSAVATGIFTQGAATEDPLWIHLAFVPKLMFMYNLTDGDLFAWGENMTNRTSKLLDTGVMQAAGNGVTPENNVLVTATDVYLREGAAIISTGIDDDYIIGVKCEGLFGCEASKAFYYAAIR